MPKKLSLGDDVVRLWRKKVQEANAEITSLNRANKSHELHRVEFEVRAVAAEAKLQAVFAAVRELAKYVPNTSVEARKARERARKLIEDEGLTPPRTLGSSRVRKKKRRSRKKS